MVTSSFPWSLVMEPCLVTLWPKKKWRLYQLPLFLSNSSRWDLRALSCREEYARKSKSMSVLTSLDVKLQRPHSRREAMVPMCASRSICSTAAPPLDSSATPYARRNATCWFLEGYLEKSHAVPVCLQKKLPMSSPR